MLRHPTSIALTAIIVHVYWVTADGCVHIAESVGSRRQLVANSCTHRRRDATRQFRRVGVGGVYWALGITLWLARPVFHTMKIYKAARWWLTQEYCYMLLAFQMTTQGL